MGKNLIISFIVLIQFLFLSCNDSNGYQINTKFGKFDLFIPSQLSESLKFDSIKNEKSDNGYDYKIFLLNKNDLRNHIIIDVDYDFTKSLFDRHKNDFWSIFYDGTNLPDYIGVVKKEMIIEWDCYKYFMATTQFEPENGHYNFEKKILFVTYNFHYEKVAFKLNIGLYEENNNIWKIIDDVELIKKIEIH